MLDMVSRSRSLENACIYEMSKCDANCCRSEQSLSRSGTAGGQTKDVQLHDVLLSGKDFAIIR